MLHFKDGDRTIIKEKFPDGGVKEVISSCGKFNMRVLFEKISEKQMAELSDKVYPYKIKEYRLVLQDDIDINLVDIANKDDIINAFIENKDVAVDILCDELLDSFR